MERYLRVNLLGPGPPRKNLPGRGLTKVEKHWLNSLNAELNPICHLLALLGAHHILHVSRIRLKQDSLLSHQKIVRDVRNCFNILLTVHLNIFIY